MAYPSSKRVLAALDLSVMDSYILSFLADNGKALSAQRISFIHVDEALSADGPTDAKQETTGLIGDDHLEKVKAKIKRSIPDAINEYAIHVVAGDPEEEIRQWSIDHDIDLLVVGQKATKEPEVEVKRLVKKPVTSLLRIPERAAYPIQTICVATDFSPLSEMAVKEAHAIAQHLGVSLIGLHTYQVPSGYHKSGKDHWEFAEVMEDNAREEAETYWQKVGFSPTEMRYVYDKDKEPATAIARFADDNSIDLLVIGSKGRTAAASILMGSVAAQITQLVKAIPLMIIKEKNKNMDLLDALKEV